MRGNLPPWLHSMARRFMTETQRSTSAVWPNEPLSDSTKSRINDILPQILQSAPFRTSRQCQDLLSYIVEKSLTNEEEALRERIIGVEVFGRRPDYDTAD